MNTMGDFERQLARARFEGDAGVVERETLAPARAAASLWALPSPDVGAGDSVVLYMRSTQPLRIRSILVDYATAEAFDLDELRIGHRVVGDVGPQPAPLSMMGAEVEGWPRAREIGPVGGDVHGLWSGAAMAVHTQEDVRIALTNRSDRVVRLRGVLQVVIADAGPE